MTDSDHGPRRTEDGGGDVTPGGTTGTDAPAVRRARAVANLLDEAVRVPGTNFRIGLDPFVGVLPVAGDSLAALLSLYPVFEAYRQDVPRSTIATMLLFVGIDAVVGSVPVLGPIFDAVWKANVWNVRALERHVERHESAI